jgi:hypothetical protein
MSDLDVLYLVGLALQVLVSVFVGVLALIGLNFVYEARRSRARRWKARLQFDGDFHT